MKTALVSLGLLLTATGPVGGPPASQEAPTPAPPPASAAESEIREAIDGFRKAFAKGDAAAVASTFTTDAEITGDSGEKIRGRDAIAAQFAGLFRESPGVTIAIAPDSIRSLGPDTAVEEGTATIATVGGPSETSRYEAVYVKQGGRWLQARVREFAEADLGPHERLKPLEWLVGDWVDEGQDGVVHTSCAWSPDGNYLLRDFRVQVRGKAAVSGTQRIAWDPSTKQVKSWTFDADGTHSDQHWAQDEAGRWIIKSSGALADGRRVTATNILAKTGKDSATWTSTDRTLGDLAAPDSETFVLVRRPPGPK